MKLQKHYPDRHNQADHGQRGSYRLSNTVTADHLQKWRQFPPAVPADYRQFIRHILSEVEDDRSQSSVLGLADKTGVPQALMLYRIGGWRPASPEDRDLEKAADLKRGDKVFRLYGLAVAPWQHREVPGRISGLGTECMARAARHVFQSGCAALVLTSRDTESDKFYTALGLTQVGRMFYLRGEDARQLWQAYQVRLRNRRKDGRVDLETNPHPEDSGQKPTP